MGFEMMVTTDDGLGPGSTGLYLYRPVQFVKRFLISFLALINIIFTQWVSFLVLVWYGLI